MELVACGSLACEPGVVLLVSGAHDPKLRNVQCKCLAERPQVVVVLLPVWAHVFLSLSLVRMDPGIAAYNGDD